ncbi:acetyltransferase (GNAT) family protein [Antricoccus suffuscus]|uniref:Acetyltransferase (GNAT) family protein n=1 Tax=Antricoccus suffuscus TaxID=1629062 RepID=A0A2T0YYW2_9ACTN|nr:GNAT family N-acetyltransferase [Antricoccus suffuscus]PRZ29273.1 acetyltransferase (GNAT) family protein [Antricoccus suffuscus]
MPPPLPTVGARVVVRHRLPSGSSHKLTDVVGRLTAAGSGGVVVESRNGPVQVALDLIVAIKVIPERPIRNRDIRNAEYAAAHGWPGLEQQWVDGWLARAGDGLSNRANSAVPLEPGASTSPATLQRLAQWYAERNLPAKLHMPDRIAVLPPSDQPTWAVDQETVFLTASIDQIVAPDCTLAVSDVPTREWLAMYPRAAEHRSGAAVLGAVLDGELGFGSLIRDGRPVGIVRAALTTALDKQVWAGLSSIEVATAHRRQGHGELLVRQMAAWSAARGATRAYLQVVATNESALRLYGRLGFTEQHRYRYATTPPKMSATVG